MADACAIMQRGLRAPILMHRQSSCHIARRIVWQLVALAGVAGAMLACARLSASQAPLVTISIVGTSDRHGATMARDGLGGLPLFAGYVNNLRAARAADGGAVVLVDAGDTFQGDVESNLSEGALVVDAYNALGYTAQAVGNHDFDFGPVDTLLARQAPGDLRGALKARAVQAKYPFLAANLLDESTGRLVDWPNVRPSALVDAAGVKIGLIGVMTIDALRSTLVANVQGLRMAPLAPAIAAEATGLRAAGADVVVVIAHAGGRCGDFDDPNDLSSCDADSEIFQVARDLPRGLVDVIAAGHTHAGLAHLVDGIAIVQPFARGQAFGRVDVVVDRQAHRVSRTQLFAPRDVCAQHDPATTACVQTTTAAVPAMYEGRVVTPDPAIVAAMAPARARVAALRATPLGISLDTALRRVGEPESPLGTLFADALRAATSGADVAIVNNAGRGLRADIPAGAITLGHVYDVFPFDNRIVGVFLTGAELTRWLTTEIQQGRRNELGLSGVRVQTSDTADGVRVVLTRADGQPIGADERLHVVTIGAPTLSGGVARGALLGADPAATAPVVREVVENWLRRRGTPGAAPPRRGAPAHVRESVAAFDRRAEAAAIVAHPAAEGGPRL